MKFLFITRTFAKFTFLHDLLTKFVSFRRSFNRNLRCFYNPLTKNCVFLRSVDKIRTFSSSLTKINLLFASNLTYCAFFCYPLMKLKLRFPWFFEEIRVYNAILWQAFFLLSFDVFFVIFHKICILDAFRFFYFLGRGGGGGQSFDDILVYSTILRKDSHFFRDP